MAPHSSTLAWRIPGTAEPAGLRAVYGVTQSQTRLKRLSSSSSSSLVLNSNFQFIGNKRGRTVKQNQTNREYGMLHRVTCFSFFSMTQCHLRSREKKIPNKALKRYNNWSLWVFLNSGLLTIKNILGTTGEKEI